MKRIHRFAALALAVCLALGSGAADFSQWMKKAAITFSGYTGAETLTNFPALVVLGSGTISGFDAADCRTGGADLRFADASGTEIPCEIEKWDAAGDSYVWVRVPELAGADTTISVYWCNPTAEAPNYAADGGVWSEDYAAVWHMQDANPADSTTNANNGAGTATAVVSGKAGGAIGFNGIATQVNAGTGASLNLPTALTVEGWVKLDGATAHHAIASRTDTFTFKTVGSEFAFTTLVVSGSKDHKSSGAALAPGNWHHLAATFVPGTTAGCKLYKNGVLLGTVNSSTIAATPDKAFLLGNNQYSQRFFGAGDEIRVSSVVRSADWLRASFGTSGDNAAFQTYGAAASNTAGLPVVENGPAVAILDVSADLIAMLASTGGAPTSVHAFWSTADCTTNASAWAAAGASADLGETLEGATLTNHVASLTPNTVYYYNFMASNEVGISWGAWHASPSFRTPGPPAATGLSADLISDRTARLKGTLSAGGATQVRMVWGTAADALVNTNDLGTLPLGAFSSALTGLAPSTTYFYAAYLVNDYGSALSATGSFTTTTAIQQWQTVGSGLWTNPATWNAAVPPPAGVSAWVKSGHSVTLDASTPALACVTNSGTLTFSGWDTTLAADAVVILGTVTHLENTDAVRADGWTPNARVNIACGDLTLSGSGKIDVNYKGYRVGVWNYPGSGPGGGVYVSSAYDGYPGWGGGGGHGGIGGGFSESPLYNGVYGDFAAPENPGSGGGGGDNPGQPLKGHGGGAVRIAATGTVTLGGGGILANGEGQGYHMGAGSGGSVYITCRTLAGGASIQASGGPGGNAGGGGGRIAVVYDKAAQQAAPLPTTVFTAAGGKAGVGNVEFLPFYDGDIGTLYFPDSQFLTRQTGPIAHAGQWMAPDFTVWSRDALTFNNAWLRFASGFRLDVTNALVVQGTDNRLHKLEVPSGDVSCGAAVVNKASLVMKADGAVAPSLVCSSFDVTNAAAFHVYASATAAPETPGARVEVANAMTVSAASWVHPCSNPTNGASPEFLVGKLDVLAGSGFDASFRGYRGGPFASNGYGPGMGKGTGSGGGGGHGGSGGGFTALLCGITNDHSYAPIFAGSSGAGGGRFDMAYHSTGGWGGGEVRIRASGDVNLAGSLLANGGTGWGWNAGGGAGGSIWLECRKFAGASTAVLSANGGKGSGDLSGSGGGGRIAVWHGVSDEERPTLMAGDWSDAVVTATHDDYAGTLSVLKGADIRAGCPPANPGTALFLTVPPPPATIFIVR